jgi:hypothetical protein
MRIIILGLTILAMVSIQSCKTSAATAASKTGDVEIMMPFSTTDCKSDENFLRVRASGKSKYDLEAASKDATINAQSKMAGSMDVLVQNVAKSYTNKLQIDGKEEFSRNLNDNIITVVKQHLKGAKVVKEKALKSESGEITYWVIMELDMRPALDEAKDKISKDEHLKQKVKEEDFDKITQEELKKMDN